MILNVNSPKDQVLVASDVAEILEIHVYTVYKMLDKGTLRGFKVGNRWRVLKSELDRFMAKSIINKEMT